jgi:nucleotide-binding universal stress UspA family protein
MKNILLATDLASETDRALERAIMLAATMKASLHILHVCPPHAVTGIEKSVSDTRSATQNRLEQYLSSNHRLGELRPNTLVIESREPFTEIIKLAEDIHADLIVMGMHGKSKLRDLFVGTTIERVLRKGVRPVLMVKDKPSADYSRLLVGTDFSAESSQALQVALKLLPSGVLHLIHSYEIPDTFIGDKIHQYAGDVILANARDKLEKFMQKHSNVLQRFADQPQNIQYRVVYGEAFRSLTREAAEFNADLIAIGVHGLESILPYRMGGTARDVLITPPCDVLIANRP